MSGPSVFQRLNTKKAPPAQRPTTQEAPPVTRPARQEAQADRIVMAKPTTKEAPSFKTLSERFKHLEKESLAASTPAVSYKKQATGIPPAVKRDTKAKTGQNARRFETIMKNRLGPTNTVPATAAPQPKKKIGPVAKSPLKAHPSSRPNKPIKKAAPLVKHPKATRAGRQPFSKEQLDKDLDRYMFQDPKTAMSRLDADLNDYMGLNDSVDMQE